LVIIASTPFWRESPRISHLYMLKDVKELEAQFEKDFPKDF
jgi:hypothetical protein